MDFPVSKFAHNKPIPPISLYYYYEKYKSLYNDYMLCPVLKNERSHRRDLNQTLVIHELGLVEDVALQHSMRSGRTSPLASEKYFTGEENTDTTQSETSVNNLVNGKDLDNLLYFLNKIEKSTTVTNDVLSEKASNPQMLNEIMDHKKHNTVSLWSRILSLTDQAMQLNIQSGITDSSFQLLLGIVVCDGLVTSAVIPGVMRLYHILQPYVSPVESGLIKDIHNCVQSQTNNAKRVKQKDEEQQCFMDEELLRFVFKKFENSIPGSYNWDVQSSIYNSSQCLHSVENLKQHMDNWFRDLEELSKIIHCTESYDYWPAAYWTDSTINHMDEDLLEQYPKYENPMLKLFSEFQE